MAFQTGGSCLLQVPLSSSLLVLPSSSIVLQSQRKQTRKQVTMASLNPVNQNGGGFLKRRAFLLVGLSALPLLDFRARAVEDLIKDEWWRNFGIDDLELQNLAIRILSQTCSSSGCERNWSVFERIHTKRRNRLEHKRLNDLVYTHYNLRLKERQSSRKSFTDPISLENIDLTDDWVVEAEDDDAPLLDVDEIDDWMNVADAILDEGEGGAAAEKQDVNTAESTQTSETLQEISLPLDNKTENQELLREESENPFVSLLNELGIIGSGVLGALYTLAQKEKTATESTVQAMRAELNEKEAAMALIEKNYEKRLLNEEKERLEQIRNFKEEQLSLSNQLASANSAIMGLKQELETSTKSIQDLKGHIDRLQISFSQALQDKQMLESKLEEKEDNICVLQEKINLLSSEVKEKTGSIENLDLALAEKETECKNLVSIYNQTKEILAKENSKVEALRGELSETREELDIRKKSVDDYSAKIEMLVSERDDISKKLNALEESYDHLKSSSTKQAASDSKLLSDKGEEIKKLKESIELVSNEANENHVLIRNLTEQRDNLSFLLEKEINNLKNLKGELETARETLKASRLEAADLTEKLKQSKQSCENLNLEVSRIETNFAQVKKSLKTNLDEVKSNSRVLSDELLSVKEVLKKSKEELLAVSEELNSAALTRESLKKELVDIYKKADSTGEDLKEERKVVASLNKELEISRKHISAEKEARQSLEIDLEEAKQSLREMSKNALSLSEQLESSNSRIHSLESEIDLLYKSHIEQKSVAIEAQENAEDAHNIITRLGNEREKLVKRAKKLEEEMASAKGEILRLRREINSSSGSVEEYQVENGGTEVGTSSVTKKNARRRKGGSAVEVSQ